MAKEEAETFLSYLTDIYPLRPGSVKCHRGHGARSSGCIARLSVCRFWNLILWIFISFDFALIFNYFGPSICRSAFLLHSSEFFLFHFFNNKCRELCAGYDESPTPLWLWLLAVSSLFVFHSVCGRRCLLRFSALSLPPSLALSLALPLSLSVSHIYAGLWSTLKLIFAFIAIAISCAPDTTTPMSTAPPLPPPPHDSRHFPNYSPVVTPLSGNCFQHCPLLIE